MVTRPRRFLSTDGLAQPTYLTGSRKGFVLKTSEVISAWGKILKGERPSLSIEITRECPLQCPGCYAYDDAHLGGGATLRSLSDRKGQELIDGVLEMVDRIRPLHLSIVGGDPLVRYRELESMVPQLLDRGIHVQVVTSAFRPLAASWAKSARISTSWFRSTGCSPSTTSGEPPRPTIGSSRTSRARTSPSTARSPVR